MNLLTRTLPKSMFAGIAVSTIGRYYFSVDKITQVTYVEQFPANNPIEDRVTVANINKGYFFGVFDGHGGDYVSNYVCTALPRVMIEKLKNQTD